MSLYLSPRRVIVPRPWNEIMRGSVHCQADVAVVAASKPAAARLLEDAGAWRMIDELRIVRGESPRTMIVELIDAGVITPGTPGIWAWSDTSANGLIIKVDGGLRTVVARLVFGRDNQMHVERAGG